MDGVGNIMIQLSKRLQTIANYITTGTVVADIGSDHALLPVFLVQSQKCPSAIAGELNTGPFQAAQKQINGANLQDKINARQGSGLDVIEPNEVDCITIAGMGGVLITEILTAGLVKGKLEGVKELVLQPNVGEDAVRNWLVQHQWLIVDESILEEDGKIYEIIHAKRAEDAEEQNALLFSGASITLPYDVEIKQALLFRMGPFLIAKNNPVLVKKWKGELKKLEYIMSSLQQSNLDSAKEKYVHAQQELKVMQEVIHWLSMETL